MRASNVGRTGRGASDPPGATTYPRARRWLGWNLPVLVATVLPLVSVPFLPFVRTSAVAPLVVPLAGLVVAAAFVTAPRRLAIPRTPAWFALAFLAVVAASYAVPVLHPDAYDVTASDVVRRLIRAFLPLVAAGLVTWMGYLLIRHPRMGFLAVVRGLLVAAWVHAAVALLSLATIVGIPFLDDAYRLLRTLFATSGVSPIGGLERATSLAVEPSFAGFEYVALWIPFTAALALEPRTRRTGLLLGTVFLAAALATASLTAAVGILVVGGIWGTWVLRRVRPPALAGVAGLVALLAVTAVPLLPGASDLLARAGRDVPAVLDGRFAASGPSDPSLAVRAALVHTAANGAVAFPFTGAGFGLAGYRFDEWRPAWTTRNPYMAEYERYVGDPNGRVFPTAKNLYVRVANEVGAVGVAVLVALVVWAVQRVRRDVRRLPRIDETQQGFVTPPVAQRILAHATLLGLAGSVVAYASLDSFGIPYLWFWIGITAGRPAS